MISNKQRLLIPSAAEQASAGPLDVGPVGQPAVEHERDAIAADEPAKMTSATGSQTAPKVLRPSAIRRAEGLSPLQDLFFDPPPCSDQNVIDALPGVDDFARFLNGMQRRNEAGEINGVGFVRFSETLDQISARVSGWSISARRRLADVKQLATEIERARDFKKTLRVGRRRDAFVQEGTIAWNRDCIADLRRDYERGAIEGLCAVIYGGDGSTRLFCKSSLSVSSTLKALEALRGLPYWVDDTFPGGFVTSEDATFERDADDPAIEQTRID